MKTAFKHIFIGLICGLATFFLSLLPVVELIELKGYDFLHFFKRYESAPVEIVLVAIDEPSFEEINKQWPWPRSLHAKLIDSLTRSGASVIGIDILFPEPSIPEEDISLSDAIKRAGNVVLASDISVIETRQYEQKMFIEPITVLKEHALTGIVKIPVDRDYVVRRLPSLEEGEMFFPEQIARLYLQKAYRPPEDAYISYASPPNSFTTVSFYQALEPEAFLPKDFFNGKIVLIGRAVRAAPELKKTMIDYFATPFLFLSKTKSRLMSGVEIHANIVSNFLKNEFVTKLSMIKKIMLFFLLGLFGSLLQIRWKPFLSGILAALFFIGYLTAAYYFFEQFRLWIPTFTLILPFFLPYGIFTINAYILSERKRGEIKRAFSHYLSPSVLESILSTPDEIKLGGEKVEATILFSDIDGFTSISENLQPEDISSLLNSYMTEMTKSIIKYNGTIDKFVGDTVMAFWGAPLPDPDHALNACRAAVSMQERLKSLKEEFKGKGQPEMSARIGINTGAVIAGNMGSADLFDYTVLGDAVNLASRLEGANKQFGTGILISGFVYEKVSGKVEARPLGNISVKGKTEQVDVYELIRVPD